MQRFFYFCFVLVLLPFYAAAAPLEIAKEAALRGDYAQALAMYQPLAEQGDAKAQFNLALMYREGAGVEKSREQAMRWLEKAAAQDLAEAQFTLGEMMIYGEDGLTRDGAVPKPAHKPSAAVERGIALVTQAAEQGLAQAQENLGYLWLHGIMMPADKQASKEKAAFWLEKAAEQDSSAAQYSLALLYLEGDGIAQDCAKALHWLTRAGELGDWAAYGELGRLYRKGQCVDKDDAKAKMLEAKAMAMDKAQHKKEE